MSAPYQPPISSLFVLRFDKRRGNTIVWQSSANGLELDSAVEFKALPSGLHALDSDLIYFTHTGQAGLSAFQHASASEAERNASFVAVGLLVPLDGSRLGKIWLHADDLSALAQAIIKSESTNPASSDSEHTAQLNRDSVSQLEAYWNQHKRSNADDEEPALDSPVIHGRRAAKGRKHRPRKRGLSESTILNASLNIHPAQSMHDFIDTFGPLVFPLYRAALSRQRLLFIRRPPMRPLCDYVYILSILAGIPHAVADDLPDGDLRPDALFTVGISDMADLKARAQTTADSRLAEDSDTIVSPGWIACTSDELLATKNDLYDIKVEFPAQGAADNGSSPWPSMTSSSGCRIYATQRDLRRYKILRRRVYDYTHASDPPNDVSDADNVRLLPKTDDGAEQDWQVPNEASVVEPMAWAAIAYDSFVWWASAGEQSADLEEEQNHDQDLISTAFSTHQNSPRASTRSMSVHSLQVPSESFEISIVAYFHRLTTLVMTTAMDAVEELEEAADGDVSPSDCAFISKSDLIRMGLDIWSPNDKAFVQDLLLRHFGVGANVQGASIECCGVRLL